MDLSHAPFGGARNTKNNAYSQEESVCCSFGGVGSNNSYRHGPFEGDEAPVSRMRNNNDDADLARELNELSVQEREKVFNDIHGVLDTPNEPPEFVAERIEQVDQELKNIPRASRTALDRAIFLKPTIETDAAFKLMFLRASSYNPKQSAKRIIKYFEDKLTLFGDEKLAKKITLDDMNEEDMKLFRAGVFMILPNRDSVGRTIWFNDVSKFDFCNSTSMIRCCWYQMMVILEDESVQLKGVSNILCCLGNWNLGVPFGKFLQQMTLGGDIVKNLPLRTTSYHFCYDNIGMEYMLAAFRVSSRKDGRLRLRTHYGASIEVQYSLLTYGIDCPLLLDNEGCNERVAVQARYIDSRLVTEQKEKQQALEAFKVPGAMIPHPNQNDVLVGRGYCYQMFKGNQMLSELIDAQYLDRFRVATSKFDKTCINMDVVKTYRETRGGRFLERTAKGWKVVDDIVARRKINNAFRSKLAKRHPSPVAPVLSSCATSAPLVRGSNDFQETCDGGGKRIRYDPGVVINTSSNDIGGE